MFGSVLSLLILHLLEPAVLGRKETAEDRRLHEAETHGALVNEDTVSRNAQRILCGCLTSDRRACILSLLHSKNQQTS